MTDATTQARANVALMDQMLAWIAERSRTYGETMDAWRTYCPRMSIWEDAISERLVAVSASPGGGMNGAAVALTRVGLSRLAGGA
jgi:hypothetical protein